MISFISKECDIQIKLSPTSLATLNKFRQTGLKKEAGGLLFAKELESNIVEIEYVTTPTKFDWRSRFGFRPNKREAQNLINENFKRGLYYVGDWHSHPQISPVPSDQDMETIKDIFCKSTHSLNYVIMLILGTTSDISKSYVTLTDGKDNYCCNFKTQD
ncbi:MAG: Mov34/MPN/PAD-1 family protein [Colwellia sp.]|nr:Mov34/MPN/PAD-1 family protein [Colwellia sp.]